MTARRLICLTCLGLFAALFLLAFLFHDHQDSWNALGLVLVLVAVLFSFFLVSRTRSLLNKAIGIVEAITSGYFENIIPTDGKGRSGDFFRALSSMQATIADSSQRFKDQVAETEVAYFKLEENTKALNELNLRLEDLNAANRVMLDTLDQGLFSFGEDGTCKDAFSKACLTFLKENPAGQHYCDLLKLPSAEASLVKRVLKQLFCNRDLSPEDLLNLLPKKFTHNSEKSISLQYRPIMMGAGGVQSVLVVATDHTAEETALRLLRERENAAQSVLRISGNRNLFVQFYRSITEFFSNLDELSNEQIPLDQLHRDIHTFKGNASFFALQDIVGILHDMESRLNGITKTAHVMHEIKLLTPSLQAAFAKAHRHACDILGNDFDRHGMTRTIPYEALAQTAAKLKQLYGARNLYDSFVVTLMGEPIRKPLAAYGMALQEMADRFGKKVSPCYFIGDNFQIPTDRYETLFSTFTHLARNIISHAIDEPEVRKQQGKAPELTVVIDTRKFMRGGQEWCGMVFEDDGKGIDVEALREKLKSNGAELPSSISEAEVMQYIFKDNVSTRGHADTLSGRGVGLSAVKQAVERLGGTIIVESERHLYTRFKIEVPLVWG